MLDTNHDLATCSEELGYPSEQFFTPLTRYANRHHDQSFCIDNGAFSRFDRKAFEALLARERPRQEYCRFVAVPDVVGSARRTLELFDYWFPLLGGWKLALVAQNGQEDLPLPWEHIDAVFIGGDDEFKDGVHARRIIKAAQMMDKWVHVGRVNGPERFAWCIDAGVDSIDGSGISRYSDMRRKLGDLVRQSKVQTALFQEDDDFAIAV